MIRNMICLFVLFLIVSTLVMAQSPSKIARKVYTTQSLSANQALVIDGKLDEEAWSKGAWATNFVQREPDENAAPSMPTAFKIMYDTKYLYVGIKNYDREPEKINHWMSRRDGFEGDWVTIIFDSYHDLRSAFSLTVTAAGVKGDKMISLNGAAEDLTWNPIWYVKTNINQEGWTAEMKIPLSQLRFGAAKNQVWGLQVVRKFFRNNETSVWQRIPLDASGWVSEFGQLQGLTNVKPQKQLELQPFLVSSLKTFEKTPLNPFKNNNQTTFNAGLDGKIGVTNDLTIDFTINPDFGQVEADPAAIALDGFQLFFREQRPFFVENKNIFNYQFSAPIVGGTFSSDNLFYSRRIGRSPQGTAQPQDGEYVKSPERTTILGAVKFSGKTKKGLSIGILESVTASTYAHFSDNVQTRTQLIEPLTNYFVARVQQDFNQRNTFVGGIVTSTIRNIEAPVNFLHQSAFTAGFDLLHQWKNRTWYVGTNLVASKVKGSKEAILRTQQSVSHLFQRVDANHLTLDSNRTSLMGTGGDIRFGKAGKGHVRFETGVTWRSPQLELNDLGFMREADDIQNYAGISYNSLKPFGLFRSGAITYQHWLKWDFEGNFNYFDWDIAVDGTFTNNWTATFGIFSQPHIFSKSLLQGGPRIYLPDQYGVWWGLGTDNRRKVFLNVDGWTKTGGEGSYYLLSTGFKLTYQPLNRLSVSMAPRYTTIQDRLQYNTSVKFGVNDRFITSKLHQETFSVALRLNYSINPNLSIQYYGQPFITTGRYFQLNYVANPLIENQSQQLAFFNANQLSFDRTNNAYHVDENEDGVRDYTFTNPDFSFAQFRSNLVIRYEYKPGSEIFLVWSQGITNFAAPRENLARSFTEQIFDQQPENTFLIKFTYRFL
ncbi:MAG TPA: hydrolase [Microscillaceae bacterium]|nr:hydrolase [Microscillaceae bacterium]